MAFPTGWGYKQKLTLATGLANAIDRGTDSYSNIPWDAGVTRNSDNLVIAADGYYNIGSSHDYSGGFDLTFTIRDAPSGAFNIGIGTHSTFNNASNDGYAIYYDGSNARLYIEEWTNGNNVWWGGWDYTWAAGDVIRMVVDGVKNNIEVYANDVQFGAYDHGDSGSFTGYTAGQYIQVDDIGGGLVLSDITFNIPLSILDSDVTNDHAILVKADNDGGIYSFENGNYTSDPAWTVWLGAWTVTDAQSKIGSYSITPDTTGSYIYLASGIEGGTYSTWFRAQNNASGTTFWISISSSTALAGFRFNSDGIQTWDGSSNADFSSKLYYSSGSWYKLEMVYNGSGDVTYNVYDSNESLLRTTTRTPTAGGSIGRIYLSGVNGTSTYFDGIKYATASPDYNPDFWDNVNSGAAMADTSSFWDANLISVWHLDEASGNAIDDKASNDLTANGTINYESEFAIMNKKAFDFEGSNDYLIKNSYSNSDNVGTISAWVKASNVAGNNSVLCTSDVSEGAVYADFRMSSDGRYELQIRSSGDVILNTIYSNKQIVADTWHHVVWTSDGSEYNIYIDGVKQSLTVEEGSNNGAWIGDIAGIDALAIGTNYTSAGPGNDFDGSIAEVLLFDKNLSDSEVEQLFFEQRGGADVRFTQDENTAQDYHLELFDFINKKMVAWYEVTDTFDASTNVEHYLYYGNSSATDDQDVSGTYPSTYNAVFHMNEGSGNVVDVTSNAQVGTQVGTPVYGAEGKINQGITFNGSTGAFQLDYHPLSGQSQGGFTAWVKSDSVSTRQAIFGDEYEDTASAHDGWYAQIISSSFRVSAYVSNVEGNAQGPAVTDDTWHHVAMAWDGSSMYAMVDGVAGTVRSVSGSFEDGTSNGAIGRLNYRNVSPAFYYYFDGTMEEVKEFDASITPNDISLLYYSESNNLITFGTQEQTSISKTSTETGTLTDTQTRIIKKISTETIAASDGDVLNLKIIDSETLNVTGAVTAPTILWTTDSKYNWAVKYL